MPTLLQVEDVPPKANGCRHNYPLREAVVDSVHGFWTPQRINALKTAIATAAGVDVSQVSNKMAARAVLAHLEERFGGTD